MPLIVRPYRDSDRDGYANVRSKVYRSGALIDPEEKLIRPDCSVTVAELDGKIVAMETEIDMTCTLRGDVLPCAGIAGVGVLPESRRGGYGLELLTKALPIYKERGWAFAALMPYRAQYYRRAGYASAGTRLAVKCPTHRIPNFDSDLPIWEVSRNDYSGIVPCYEAFAQRYSGMNVRKEGQWFWQLGGDNRFAMYAAGDPAEAYVSVKLKVEFWVEQEVRDFTWTTPRGYKAILSFLRGLCINKTSVEWYAPSDDPILWLYDDQAIAPAFDGWMMYRAVDVPEILSRMRSESEGEFTIGVDDPHLAENRGPWRVRFGKAGVEVEKGKSADFELSIGGFTQAALGEPSFDALLRMGEVDVLREAGAQAARKFFTPFPTFTLDFF